MRIACSPRGYSTVMRASRTSRPDVYFVVDQPPEFEGQSCGLHAQLLETILHVGFRNDIRPAPWSIARSPRAAFRQAHDT